MNNNLEAPDIVDLILNRRVWKKTLVGYQLVYPNMRLSEKRTLQSTFPIHCHVRPMDQVVITEETIIRHTDEKYWTLAEFVISTTDPTLEKDNARY